MAEIASRYVGSKHGGGQDGEGYQQMPSAAAQGGGQMDPMKADTAYEAYLAGAAQNAARAEGGQDGNAQGAPFDGGTVKGKAPIPEQSLRDPDWKERPFPERSPAALAEERESSRETAIFSSLPSVLIIPMSFMAETLKKKLLPLKISWVKSVRWLSAGKS